MQKEACLKDFCPHIIIFRHFASAHLMKQTRVFYSCVLVAMPQWIPCYEQSVLIFGMRRRTAVERTIVLSNRLYFSVSSSWHNIVQPWNLKVYDIKCTHNSYCCATIVYQVFSVSCFFYHKLELEQYIKFIRIKFSLFHKVKVKNNSCTMILTCEVVEGKNI